MIELLKKADPEQEVFIGYSPDCKEDPDVVEELLSVDVTAEGKLVLNGSINYG